MQPYASDILLHYDEIMGILKERLAESECTDAEISLNLIKFYFPIEGFGQGMFAHAPEDDVKDKPWINSVRTFVRETFILSTDMMVNSNDLINVKYTVKVSELAQKIENLKRIQFSL